MRRGGRNRQIEIFSLSFLDVVSCGFGAIVLLLVISQFSEPRVIEQIREDMTAQVMELQEEKKALEAEARRLTLELASRRGAAEALEREIRQLEATLAGLQDRSRAARTEADAKRIILSRLQDARQELTQEMERLALRQPETSVESQVIGGVPVDSEYIVFVIDTSGSMQRYAWPLVRKKMAEILRIYPRVKGIQVMNDMGDFMFEQYARRWIPDSPARRRAILSRLVSWAPFSNSSPVEGVTRAIRLFHAKDKKISIYVFGDDFAQGSIQGVIDTINGLNSTGPDGRRRVRIHAIGFPVLLQEAPNSPNIARFAALMRRLAEDNDGTFVGLSSLK